MAVSCVRVKSDGIIDWEKPNADFQRMVKLAHLVFSKRTKLIPQSAFIDGAKLLQQDDNGGQTTQLLHGSESMTGP